MQKLSIGSILKKTFFVYFRSELTKSYITINTKHGKTKTIEKIIPIIHIEDPNETSVIEYLGEPDEAQCSKIRKKCNISGNGMAHFLD